MKNRYHQAKRKKKSTEKEKIKDDKYIYKVGNTVRFYKKSSHSIVLFADSFLRRKFWAKNTKQLKGTHIRRGGGGTHNANIRPNH